MMFSKMGHTPWLSAVDIQSRYVHREPVIMHHPSLLFIVLTLSRSFDALDESFSSWKNTSTNYRWLWIIAALFVPPSEPRNEG
jgi:hypothetical protein